MNPPLKLLTDASILARVQRNILTRFLEDYSSHLSPEAAALLITSSDSLTPEEFCAAWAHQFGSIDAFGVPLQEALRSIELLATPENASILDDTLSHLPPGYDINRNFSRLHQALHLWLLAHSPVGIAWPDGRAERPREAAPGNAGPAVAPICTPHSATSAPAAAPRSDAPNAPDVASSQPAIAVPLSTLNSELSASLTESDATASDVPFSVLPSSFSPPQPEAEADAAAKAVLLRRLKPWPDPISDAPALFDQVHDRALHYLYLPPGAAVVFTLWPGHAHVLKAFAHSPRLCLTSPEPGCGKSTALDFVACLCPNLLRTDNLRPAVLFRLAHNFSPTLALDEFDTYAHQYPDLRGLINSGYFHDGAAFRCEGLGVRAFKSFAATVLAGIGDVADTVRDRSITIHLTKAPAGSLHARFDRRHTGFETALGRKIARWAEDNFAAIDALRDPIMPPEAINRLADNWRPLFAVAQVIGGHWTQRLVEAFKQITSRPQPGQTAPSTNGHASPSTIANQLLADVRHVFADAHADRLFSSYIVHALHALPNRSWAGGANGSKPLTVTALARHLSSLGIHSRPIRIGADLARGYLLSALTPPATPCQPPVCDFQI